MGTHQYINFQIQLSFYFLLGSFGFLKFKSFSVKACQAMFAAKEGRWLVSLLGSVLETPEFVLIPEKRPLAMPFFCWGAERHGL